MANIQNKIKILHVDDEADTLTVVKKILENEGYEVVSVSSGGTALGNIKLNGFSLIILDIMMPDMSGWELFTKIGLIRPDYKVIFLSILELPPEKRKELFDAGVKDYIQKPFDRTDLVNRVKKAISF